MAKQLSQEEIDALLQVRTQTPGAESYDQDTLESLIKADEEERVHPYNFKRPRSSHRPPKKTPDQSHGQATQPGRN